MWGAGADAGAQSLRIALAKQPFSPTGTSLARRRWRAAESKSSSRRWARLRLDESKLTAVQDTEYGAWKRLGWALGDFAKIVAKNERDGFFTVGLYATCPSMPGMVAGSSIRVRGQAAPRRHALARRASGLQYAGDHAQRIDGRHARCHRHGSRAQELRLDATLDPPLRDEDVVMAGVRLTDPLEQDLLDHSKIQQLSVDDIRKITPAVWRQLDRLNAQVDKLYIHIDMDVLDPREVSMHVNKVPGGPSSEELATLLEQIFARYPKATAVGFATLPPSDPGGLSIAALIG